MKRFSTARRTAAMLFALCFRADTGRSIMLFGYAIVSSALLLIAVVEIKPLVDAVVSKDGGGVMLAAGTIAGAVVLASLCNRGFVALTGSVMERAGLYVDAKLIELSAAVPTVEHFERPQYVDQMTLVRQERRVMAQMMNALAMNLQSLLYLVSAVVLLATIDLRLLLLPLFGLPAVVAHRRSNKIALRAREANAQRTLLLDHLYRIASSPASGKELRIFGLVGVLAGRHRETAKAMEREATRASLRAVALASASALIFTIGYFGAAAIVLVDAVHRTVPIGSVVLAIALATMVNGQISTTVQSGGYFAQVLKTAGRLVWLTDYAAEHAKRPTDQVPVPDRLGVGIEIEDLSFTYPGTEKLVLDRIRLSLPAGAVVALVGDNGSGKTTLVKLLSGMYRPSSGRITVDGVDLERFDPAAWQSLVSGAFQDFVRFELRLGQAVGVGDLPRIDQSAPVAAALDRVDASDLAELPPDGLMTQLGTAWGGVDLSGGQWQKLALGRTVMRENPLLVVLDEPTAALDAETEHAVFERFAEIASGGAADGHVTLLVSHRITTVRMADVIVVLEAGRVAEIGSHDELCAANGLYAKLYGLQQQAYR